MQELVFKETLLLVALLLAHLLADFYFQPYSWVESRNKRHVLAPHLYLHALLHGLLAGIAILVFASDLQGMTVLCGSAIIAVTHFKIDVIKSYCPQTTTSFIVDQLAHVLVIIAVYLFMTSQFNTFITVLKAINVQHLAIVLAYLAVLKPSSIIIKQLLSPWSAEVTSERPKHSHANDALTLSLEAQQTLALAGQRIGYLERTLMLTFVLLNQFAAIGFLIAAKSIFRFGDLTKHQDRKLTEYVLLGTFSSVVITLIIGLACAYLLGEFPIKR
ncbi:DUF3307 domain-containing protein [Alteromonas sp. 009811495]|uniref:DUF3307 domain-containing protein n=1 Tax=Alteromonas sp. 009811495 TaxID=3002962 RepID=UPI00237D8F1E|nr:DUF3307 domain-containing protein [Alteromonas sp. 009811495]WDT84517.1 DUF3307 domain-containing protein [Alteromonas sp. 009811495]